MDMQLLLLQSNRRLLLRLFLASKIKKKEKRQKFALEKLNDHQCKSLFRFGKEEIVKLRELLQIPWKVTCRNGTACSGLEGLCILLRRLAYPNRLFDLEFVFYRKAKDIGLIFNKVLDHILEKFGHLLEDLNQSWLTKQWLYNYADAIKSKGAPLQKCWGFIDGTVRAMCRPSKYQQECYNGHKRVHSLKYQSVIVPNGVIANLYGPIEGRRHDSFLLSESNLLPRLEQFNEDEAIPFCIYGDPAYPLRPELQAPFKGSRVTAEQQLFNKKMSAVRISVEWAFGKVLQLFAFVDYKKNQKLYLQPLAKYFRAAVLLTNVHTCMYGSQTSEFFNVTPPKPQEYLRSRE